MEELKEKYESVVTKRKAVIEELNNLKENELVKRYIELLEQKSSLYIQQERLYVELKNKEYENCNHIWITSKIDMDYMEGRSYRYEGCIKCGLTTEVFSDSKCYEFLSAEEKIMYDYLKSHNGDTGGITSNRVCDLELAKAIYKKIHDALPDLDDEVACKYFEIALDNIRENNKGEDKKNNRIKRLSLDKKFNKWNSYDVSE